MTRKQAAYLRAVKHHLNKMGKTDAFDQTTALQHFDSWVNASFAAEQMAAPLRARLCVPVTIEQAAEVMAGDWLPARFQNRSVYGKP